MFPATTDVSTPPSTSSPVLHQKVANNGHWIVFAAVMVVGFCAALFLYDLNEHALTYYGDSASHLVEARKLVDWGEDPGLGRFGTVWLPLPHLLLLPFTLDSSLFSTGFAGAAVSLPSLALTAAFLYKIIRVHLDGSAYLAATGALLYALNPNTLYLGLIAMTEAPFMLLFVAAAYFFVMWYREPHDLHSLTCSSILVALATLCRYEGWILPLFLIPATLLVLVRVDLSTPRKLAGLLLALMSSAGALLWMGYNALQYGDPMEFSNAEYYSAAWQALSRDVRQTLFLQPANIIAVYGVHAFTIYGPILLAAAGLGLVRVARRLPRSSPDIRPLLAFLAMPPLFTLFTLLIGVGELGPGGNASYWFNSRFLVLLSPLLIMLLVTFVQGLPRRSTRGRVVVAIGLAACFAVHTVMIALDKVPVYLEARGGFVYRPTPSAVEAGEALGSAYDGGKTMIITGSAQEHRIMLIAGIPLGQYDEIVASSTWKTSYSEPWRYDRWLVMSRDPGPDAKSAAEYWNARRAELFEHYEKVYENEFYEILLRTDR